MATCRKCNKKLPVITVRNARHPNPFGNGCLCSACYQPYRFVMETYTANIKHAETDPKAAAWIILCCLLAAQRINLVYTLIAVLCGITETTNSWEVCRQKSIKLAHNALPMLISDPAGQVFVKALLNRAKELVEPSRRQLSIQKYGSVFGDTIIPIEAEAIKRSGVSIDELNAFAKSFPGHEWLLPQ